jgi:predicted phage tail protein
LSVAFTAPSSNGGAAISNYKYSLDNGATWIARSPTSTSSPLVITGLTNGTSYQVKVLAINSQGDGAESLAVTETPAASAAPSALTVSPSTTLASTGSSALSHWGLAGTTILAGLALVLMSSARRRLLEKDHG